MKFRKKPVEVDAYQVTREMIEGFVFDLVPYPKGLRLSSSSRHTSSRSLYEWYGSVTTIHGQATRVTENDWIIDEGDGIHFYPCKPDVFAKTYDGIHLCDECFDGFATCKAKKVVFGIDRDPSARGKDADIVLECDSFKRKVKP